MVDESIILHAIQVEYVEIGKVKVNTAKIVSAKKAPNAFKMARKLLPEFFTPEELCTCTCVPPKPGKSKCSQADPQKLGLLLGMYYKYIYISYVKVCISNLWSNSQKFKLSTQFP